MEQQLVEVQGVASPERAPRMGFVMLGADPAPVKGKSYDVVPADALEIASLSTPAGPERYFDLDVLSFYSGNLPDWGRNEGLVKIQVDTRPPQEIGNDVTASFVAKCSVRDMEYAGGFLYRGVFRNVIFGDYLNLRFGLTELDGDAGPFLDKIQGVLKDVPEIKQLDVLKGIPYLELGTKLVEGILRTFGKNPDDELWTETPLLSIDPLTAGAYLRRGVYVVFDRRNGYESHFPDAMTYTDGAIRVASEQLRNTHLIFSAGVRQRTVVPA